MRISCAAAASWTSAFSQEEKALIAMDGAADAVLVPYEQQRADRIARNQKVLGGSAYDRALSVFPAVPLFPSMA